MSRGTAVAFALGVAPVGSVGAADTEPGLAAVAVALLTPRLRAGEEVRVLDDVAVVRLRRRRRVRSRASQLQRVLHAGLAAGGTPGLVIGTGLGRGRRRQAVAVAGARESLLAGDHMARPDLARTGSPALPTSWHTGVQVVATVVLTTAVPLGVYALLAARGIDAAGAMAPVLATVIAVMALLVWGEALASLRRRPRPTTTGPAPRASAVVAAYLPNEAETVIATLNACLDQDYRGGMQVVLAYNTPRPLPVEAELRALAVRRPELQVLRVSGSTSKAENVNAALAAVTGEIVGIYDADHQPAPDVFTRAWEHLSTGVDVVQGRCSVRNGEDSVVAGLVACEFEQIYGVSHPGRQRLHGFGVFGGSNGYWRTDVLRRIRLRPSYLTEDIESSVRAVREGLVIVNDPAIVSRELAPTTLAALWRQRLRWAQGWWQVTVRHVHGVITSPGLGLQRRIGLVLLLAWREAFAWLSALMLPTLAFLAWEGRITALAVPGAAVLAFSVVTAPAQAVIAWTRALPEIRRRRTWWLRYLLLAPLYSEWRNLVMRVAVLKELRGERHWAVTPRVVVAGGSHAGSPAVAPPPGVAVMVVPSLTEVGASLTEDGSAKPTVPAASLQVRAV